MTLGLFVQTATATNASNTKVSDASIPVVVRGTGEPGGVVAALPTDEAEAQAILVDRVAADGTFQLGAPNLAILANHADKYGSVNLTVLVPTTGHSVPFGVVVELGDPANPKVSETQIIPAQEDPATFAQRIASAPGGSPTPNSSVTDSNNAVAANSVAKSAPVEYTTNTRSTGLAPQDDIYECKHIWKQYLGSRRTLVAGQYATNTGARTTATFQADRKTTFGIGYSVSGKFGSWGLKGTTDVAQGTSTQFPAARSNKNNYTYFAFNKYQYRCTYGGVEMSSEYRARATRHGGGAVTTSPSAAPSGWQCRDYEKGTTFTQNKSRAHTYTTGADLTGPIGAYLTTTTGFNSGQRIYINIDAWKVRLCGTKGYPGNFPNSNRIIVRGT